LVDDDKDVLAALRRALWNQQYHVLAVEDPREAKRLLESEDIDAILSDIDMPELNGLDLMRIARDVRPSAVRILVTGRGTIESATRAINDGEVHRFVHKPFDAVKLRLLVKEALERKTELAIATQAGQRVERRRLLFEQLEEEHPGITRVPRDSDGAYLLDGARARAVAPEFGLEPFVLRGER
jgi:DNA-binding NtrC family response regulator